MAAPPASDGTGVRFGRQRYSRRHCCAPAGGFCTPTERDGVACSRSTDELSGNVAEILAGRQPRSFAWSFFGEHGAG